MKIFSTNTILLLCYSALALTGAEPTPIVEEVDTNKVMCTYIKKLEGIREMFQTDNPAVPTEFLVESAKETNSAIQRAKQGNILESIKLVKKSIAFSQVLPGSLAESLSISACNESRWLAEALIAIAESDESNLILEKALEHVQEGSALQDDDQYKESVTHFIEAVYYLILRSPIFQDKFLEAPVCGSTKDIKRSLVPANGSALPLPSNARWRRLGNDLYGKWGDYFGWTVSLSKSGEIMAVGSPGRYVAVYRLDSSVPKQWVPMGQQIVRFGIGANISLNGAGNIMAIGALSNRKKGRVLVYKFDDDTSKWLEIGQIKAKARADRFGSPVSLNESGDVVAVGATRAMKRPTDRSVRVGSVSIFKLNHDTGLWEELGETLWGKLDSEEFGDSISLSSSGMIVAIGAPRGGTKDSEEGQVSVYEYKSAKGKWILMGEPTKGESKGNLFGGSVSLDSSGLVVGVGATRDDYGSASVLNYDYTTKSWKQRGQKVTGDATADLLGKSVSLNYDGNVLAVGVPQSDQSSDRGLARVYQYDESETNWIQVGSDMNGKAMVGRAGSSVSLSGSGTEVAVGAPLNKGKGFRSGNARVYELTTKVNQSHKNQTA